jgi:hypothetical protein
MPPIPKLPRNRVRDFAIELALAKAKHPALPDGFDPAGGLQNGA